MKWISTDAVGRGATMADVIGSMSMRALAYFLRSLGGLPPAAS